MPTWHDNDFNSDNSAVYKGGIDGNMAIAKRIANAFNVHEQSTPDMTVRVDPGYLFDRDSLTLTSKTAQNSGTITAPSTNPRIDRVVMDSSGNISVITGSEAASPSAPAITTGKIPLAQISLAVSQTEITNDDITDERGSVLFGLDVPNLTELTSLDTANDKFPVFDAANNVLKFIIGNNMALGGGGLIGISVHESSGTYTKNNDAGSILVITTGAGGAGGGATTSPRAGKGGGAGATCIEMIDNTGVGSTETVTIGTGGTGGTGDGAAGGNSSFGTFHTANGGSGGSSNLTSGSGNGTAGGSGTGGDINIAGGPGSEVGYNGANRVGGQGGASFFGGGGAGGTSTSSGQDGAAGAAFGAGGGGGMDNGGNGNGGDGKDGVCIVLEFA